MDGGRQVPRTQPSRTPRRRSSFASPSAPHAPLLPRPPSPSGSSKPPLLAATDAASRAPQAAAVPVPFWSVLAEATSPDLCRVAPSSPARTAPLLRPDWQSAAVSLALTDAKSPAPGTARPRPLTTPVPASIQWDRQGRSIQRPSGPACQRPRPRCAPCRPTPPPQTGRSPWVRPPTMPLFCFFISLVGPACSFGPRCEFFSVECFSGSS